MMVIGKVATEVATEVVTQVPAHFNLLKHFSRLLSNYLAVVAQAQEEEA
jgi:hypothetical protein